MTPHEHALALAVAELAAAAPDCSVLLLGSLASGEQRPDSDIDLIVFFSRPPAHYTDLIPAARRTHAWRGGVEIDVGWGLLASLPEVIPDDDCCRWYPYLKARILRDPSGRVARLLALGRAWLTARPWLVAVWEEQLAAMRRHKLDPTQPLQFSETEFKEHLRLLVAQRAAPAAPPPALTETAPMIPRERIEWLDTWVTGGDGTTLPRLLLVGDSITRSYYGPVEQRLGSRFACARLTTSKCVCDPLFLAELRLLLDAYPFAVVHFNNGLHGWDFTEAQYAAGLAAAFDAIAAPGRRLIWATTTPVRVVGNLAALDPKTDRVRERNRLAAALCAPRGLAINDLFAALVDRPALFSADGVHLTAEGQSVLGAQVAACIGSAGAQ